MEGIGVERRRIAWVVAAGIGGRRGEAAGTMPQQSVSSLSCLCCVCIIHIHTHTKEDVHTHTHIHTYHRGREGERRKRWVGSTAVFSPVRLVRFR